MQQTELLARLVEDLRTLSLAEAGKLSLDLREVNLVGTSGTERRVRIRAVRRS